MRPLVVETMLGLIEWQLSCQIVFLTIAGGRRQLLFPVHSCIMSEDPPPSDSPQPTSLPLAASQDSPILSQRQAVETDSGAAQPIAGTDPNHVDPLKKYETVVSSGQSALRALFTLNGGATIAFLTFLGHLWDKPPGGGGALPLSGGGALVIALKLFIYGSFFAVLAYGTIFLTNCLSTIEWKHARWKTIGKVMFGITVVLGVVSIGCFLAGSWKAVDGFESVGGLLARRPK